MYGCLLIVVEKEKGWNPNPFVVLPGFEPGQTEPKPVVLPLHHKTILSLREVYLSKAMQSYDYFFELPNFWAKKICFFVIFLKIREKICLIRIKVVILHRSFRQGTNKSNPNRAAAQRINL